MAEAPKRAGPEELGENDLTPEAIDELMREPIAPPYQPRGGLGFLAPTYPHGDDDG
jgi:hypothetical protein